MAVETSQPGQTSAPLTHVDQYLAIAQAGGASDLAIARDVATNLA